LDKVKWRSTAWSSPGRLGVREDGTLWTLSDHYESPRSVREELVRIGNATNWVSVVASYTMLVALKTDGSLWKWEWERNSWQFEQKWTTHPPTRLGIHNDWVAIGGGWNGIVSLAGDGSLWNWPDRFIYSASLLQPSRKPEKIENIFDAEQ
jgi:alpha-tubulin suppressor-like RCC1 family protein